MIQQTEQKPEKRWGWHAALCQNPGNLEFGTIRHEMFGEVRERMFNCLEIVEVRCTDCKEISEISQPAWQNESPWWTM